MISIDCHRSISQLGRMCPILILFMHIPDNTVGELLVQRKNLPSDKLKELIAQG